MATGYGYDTSCTDGIDTARMVSGVELVAQALYRRLTTPRGSLTFTEAHLTYGFDVTQFVGLVGYQIAEQALPAQIENELLQDDRVDSVECAVTLIRVGIDYTLRIVCGVTLEDAGGNFDLTMTVAQARLTLESVS